MSASLALDHILRYKRTAIISPLDLAGLIGWWSPINSGGFDVNGFTPDLSGVNPGNHNLYNAAGGAAYNATGLNGYPAYVIATAALGAGLVTKTLAGTAFTTKSFAMGTQTDAAVFMVGSANPVTSANFGVIASYWEQGATTYGVSQNWMTANVVGQTAFTNTGRGGSSGFNAGAGVAFSASTPTRFIWTCQAGVITLYINGVAVGTDTGASNSAFGSPGIFCLGNHANDGGTPAVATYGDVFVTSVVPSGALITAADTWMKNRYGL